MENLCMEYGAIRDEIILLMNEHNTHITNLFLMSITILGLGYTLDKPVLFLMLYLVIIPFQILINNKEYMMVRCGVYIKKYIEPELKTLKWEQRIHEVDAKFNEVYKFKIGKIQIENRICDYGAFMFSLISLGSYILYKIEINNSVISIHVFFSIWGIIMALIATAVTFRLCQKASNFKELTVIFEKIIDEQIMKN